MFFGLGVYASHRAQSVWRMAQSMKFFTLCSLRSALYAFRYAAIPNVPSFQYSNWGEAPKFALQMGLCMFMPGLILPLIKYCLGPIPFNKLPLIYQNINNSAAKEKGKAEKLYTISYRYYAI